MYHRFQRASLVPDGFLVYSIQIAGGSVQIQLRSRSRSGGGAAADGLADAFKADI